MVYLGSTNEIINMYQNPTNIGNLEQDLLAKNINPTAMRLLVLGALKQKSEAVTFSDIESSFEQSDRVTIYRTLKTFEQKGLIHTIVTGNITQYALCSEACDETKHRDTHLHFICRVCQKTICLTQFSIPEVEIPKGFHVDDVEVTIKGVCEDCFS